MWAFMTVFALLPIDWASALGGALAGMIGPWLPVSERARRNITRAMPELDRAEVRQIIRGMWRNIGRVIAEYPHLAEIDPTDLGDRITISGLEHVEAAERRGKGGILCTAHFGNWEIAGVAADRYGLRAGAVYRAPNNPVVDRLVQRYRGTVWKGQFPKGPASLREMVRWLRDGNYLGIMVDQKLNNGIPVPFFGRDAMTAPVLAELALKYDCPVVAARVDRARGARFRISLSTIELPRSESRQADVAETMRRVNAKVESWVRDRPDHWFWLHRRWPD